MRKTIKFKVKQIDILLQDEAFFVIKSLLFICIDLSRLHNFKINKV